MLLLNEVFFEFFRVPLRQILGYRERHRSTSTQEFILNCFGIPLHSVLASLLNLFRTNCIHTHVQMNCLESIAEITHACHAQLKETGSLHFSCLHKTQSGKNCRKLSKSFKRIYAQDNWESRFGRRCQYLIDSKS